MAGTVTVNVVDASGKAHRTLDLDGAVFGAPIHGALLHQAVVRELNGRRAGTHEAIRGGFFFWGTVDVLLGRDLAGHQLALVGCRDVEGPGHWDGGNRQVIGSRELPDAGIA